MQDAANCGSGASGADVQRSDNGVTGDNGVTVTIGVTLTVDERAGLAFVGAVLDSMLAEPGADALASAPLFRTAQGLFRRMLDAAFAADSGNCERCYVERARIVKQLNEQLLDETPSNAEQLLDETPSNAGNLLSQMRDAGYRAGWNDRSRALAKELQS